jgi:DNA-binding NarL/FixJ family response regulator
MNNFKKQTFIIADDHAHFIKGLRFALNPQTDLECIGEAYNGAHLLEMLKVNEPDVVFLDINMPVMGGEEALLLIKAYHKKVKVIILSMHQDYNITMKLMALGANSYVTKDADIDVILDTVRNLKPDGTAYFNTHVKNAFEYINNFN